RQPDHIRFHLIGGDAGLNIFTLWLLKEDYRGEEDRQRCGNGNGPCPSPETSASAFVLGSLYQLVFQKAPIVLKGNGFLAPGRYFIPKRIRMLAKIRSVFLVLHPQ